MAKTIVVDLEAKTDKAVKELEDLRKEVGKLNNSVVDGNEKTEKSLKSVEGASKSVSKGVKKIGTTLKAIGIGVLISALGTIKDLFTQNQRAVDLFNIVFESTSIVINQITTALVDTYDAITNTKDNFDALGKVVGGVITLALTPLKGTFYAIKLALQTAQLAWEESFFGDKDPETIKRLNLSILETKENILGVAEGAVNAGRDIVNNFSEAITETANIGKVVVKELSDVNVKAAIEQAKLNVSTRNAAELAVAQQGLLVEKYDQQAEKLRQLRDDDRLTIEERKKANNELLNVLELQEQAMLRQADLQVKAAQNAVNTNNNIENQKALIEALANRQGVLAQIEGFRSEQKANDLALDRESIELNQSKIDGDTERYLNDQKFRAEQIEGEYQRFQALLVINQQERDLETARLEEKRNLYKEGTQAYIDANNELLNFQQANGQQQIELEKKVADSKRMAVMGALGQIAGIVGESSKFGKAVAIAQAVQDTYAGATKAFQQGGIFGFVGAAAITAAGLGNVKKIASSKPPALPSFASGGGGASGGGSLPSSQPPSFNVVGASSNSQLAEAISSQEQEPIKAYVVSNDVTTAQSMDRNIVDGATL